jgi:CubicO group peptidase (beta-lactamase class C family)
VPKVQHGPSDRFGATADLIRQAVEQRAFPAAVIEVGDPTRVLWRHAFGHLHGESEAPEALDDTIFDLASLTKVLATTAIAMQQVERGGLGLDDPVGHHIPAWTGADRLSVTVRDLLAHCSGLTAHLPFFRTLSGGTAFEQAICESALTYVPRSASVYSDLGFMLLGFILGREVSLEDRFVALQTQMSVVEDLQFRPPSIWRSRIAPTEFDAWRGRLLVGEVHDENAAALDGAAGHSGLFGTSAAVGQHARHLLQILAGRGGVFRRSTVEAFAARRADVQGSSRALGWDTMLPTSSCGRRMSARAFGHTGFTGTSLWIDPDREIYVVFLTNRVCPSRENEAIRLVRPAVHDAVMDALESSS